MANIGVACGSGLVVIDIDGRDALDHLRAEHGHLPVTRVVTTARGWHIYFATPYKIGCRSGRLPIGVDVRGDGGYVIGAGSVHASGRSYRTIVNAPLAPLPAVLFDAIRPTTGAQPR